MTGFRLTVVVFFMMASQAASAQPNAKQLFNLLCKELEQAEKRISLKEDLNQMTVVYDPVSGVSNILYPEIIDSSLAALISRHSKEEMIAILDMPDMELFPLTDTLYIIDTTLTFEDGTYWDNLMHLRIKRTCPLQEKHCLHLFAKTTESDRLILSFKQNGGNEIYSFHFSPDGTKLNKLRVLKNEKNNRVWH